jgi:SAM-dependent methyltransferase
VRPYFFGVYHWRERLRRIGVAALLLAVAARLARRGSLVRRAAGLLLALPALARGGDAVRRLCSPPPWALDRAKYDALGDLLDAGDATRVLDVGCGTGRSLVGLAPHLPDGCRVVGVDVFDDRVILGNGPGLARANGGRAGLDVSPVRGDASRLPVADGAADVVTACRVLHDVPVSRRADAAAELRRACAEDGVVGVLELPKSPEGVAPVDYWCDLLATAGLSVERVRTVPRPTREGEYVAIAATPTPG